MRFTRRRSTALPLAPLGAMIGRISSAFNAALEDEARYLRYEANQLKAEEGIREVKSAVASVNKMIERGEW